MSAKGMTLTVLATYLAEAVAKDETPEEGGCDVSAGLYGPNASAWLRGVAEEIARLKEHAVVLANTERHAERARWTEAVMAELDGNGQAHAIVAQATRA